jgi:O-antigen ligase
MPDKNTNLFSNITFLFFLLFIFNSAFSIAYSQISLGISLLAFLVLIVTSKYNPFTKELRHVYFAISVYIIWMTITSLTGETPMKSLFMLKEEWLFCIIPIGIYLFRKRQYRYFLIIALAVGVTIVSIYGVIQHYTGVNWFKDYLPVKAPDGTFYALGGFHHNLTYGNYLAVASIFLISVAIMKTRQLFNFPQLVLFVGGVSGFLGTIMSYSRTAFVALPIALVVTTWLKGKRWAIVSTIVVVVMTFVTFLAVEELGRKFEIAIKSDLTGENESSRFFIWEKTLSMIADRPIVGVGQGNFEETYKGYLLPELNEVRSRPHAHNDVLNFAAIAGIPGALFYLLIWIAVYYNLHNIWHKSSIDSDKRILAGAAAVGGFAFFLTSLTEATFADEEIRQLLMVVWAAGLWPLISSGEESPSGEAESA